MLQGMALRSGRLLRQPQSSTSESDATCDRRWGLFAEARGAFSAQPAHTGSGGRITSWVWGRGLEKFNGRFQDSLFFDGDGRQACTPPLCLYGASSDPIRVVVPHFLRLEFQ